MCPKNVCMLVTFGMGAVGLHQQIFNHNGNYQREKDCQDSGIPSSSSFGRILIRDPSPFELCRTKTIITELNTSMDNWLLLHFNLSPSGIVYLHQKKKNKPKTHLYQTFLSTQRGGRRVTESHCWGRHSQNGLKCTDFLFTKVSFPFNIFFITEMTLMPIIYFISTHFIRYLFSITLLQIDKSLTT